MYTSYICSSYFAITLTLRKLLFILCFAWPVLLAKGNVSIQYVITSDDDTVGHLTVSSWQSGDTMIYEYFSDATVKFFGSHHVISRKTCKYVGSKLVSSISTHYENGSLRDSVTLFWRGTYYDVYENGDYDKQTDAVNFGAIKMFFAEPKGEPKVFAEVKLEFQDLTCTAKGCYMADAGWGRKNMYYYDIDGQLIRAEINSPLIDFQLHLVN